MVTSLPARAIRALPIGTTKSSSFGTGEGLAVENFVLKEDHRVGIADRRLQQALGVGRGVGRDHLQARDVRVPGGIVLAVLGGDARGAPFGPRNTIGQPIWPPDM